MSLRVQEDVFRLQVPVDNVQGVQVAQSAGDFSSVETGTRFQKAPFSLKVIEELQKERERKKNERRENDYVLGQTSCEPYLISAFFTLPTMGGNERVL